MLQNFKIRENRCSSEHFIKENDEPLGPLTNVPKNIKDSLD